MSDDPNRPDAEHELEVDLSAFLPEGSRFATDDDGDDEMTADHADGDQLAGSGDAAGSSDVTSDSADDGGTEMPVDTNVSGGAPEADDGWDTGAPAPEIPAWARDDLPPPPVIDRSAGVPEEPAAAASGPESDPQPESAPDGAAASGPAPDPGPAPAPDAGPVASEVSETDAGPAPVPDAGPVVPTAPEVDTTVLSRIEGELADVDAAIAAIDAGDLTRSPLLTELLSADATPLRAAPAATPTSSSHPN